METETGQRVGPLEIIPRKRAVMLGDEPVKVTAKEYELLTLLASVPTRVFTHNELIRNIWGVEALSESEAVKDRKLFHLAHSLHWKLRRQGGDARFVLSVWGVGYRLIDPDDWGIAV